MMKFSQLLQYEQMHSAINSVHQTEADAALFSCILGQLQTALHAMQPRTGAQFREREWLAQQCLDLSRAVECLREARRVSGNAIVALGKRWNAEVQDAERDAVEA